MALNLMKLFVSQKESRLGRFAYQFDRRKPVTPAIDIQSIVTKEGKLFPYHSVLIKKIVLKQSQIDQVRIEVENQIQRCTSAGIQLTHVDGHQHLTLSHRFLRLSN